ncbi:ATP-binding protein [Aquitalea sp.]|uniref:ATP-binding protein n=1 Tax=Aquitalea sp. TaxID=1872623 RepID=UPI00258B0212|nr:ATP-binding protein [Aquitalea sp.]
MSIIHRIAVVGPESCGKSTLSAQLAASMQAQGVRASHVTEYARDYYANRPYQVAMPDIEAIACGQLQAEQAAARQHDWLVCDTTVLICKIWAEVAFGQASPALLQHYRPQDYVLTLLTATDIPWQPDPLRSHPAERDWLLSLYQAELAAVGIVPVLLQGSEAQRLQQAWHALRQLPEWGGNSLKNNQL